MDSSIERINEYRLHTSIEHSPVILKRQSSSKLTIIYLVFPCNEKHTRYILKYLKLSALVRQKLIEGNYINTENDIEQVLHCGKLNEFPSYSQLVYKFPQRKADVRNRVEPTYRFYEYTREKQLQHLLVHNICPTAEHSWNSVIRKVGSEYGLVLKIKIVNNVESNNKLDK